MIHDAHETITGLGVVHLEAGAVVLPAAKSRMAWTELWEDGECFRYEIADISLFGPESPQ